MDRLDVNLVANSSLAEQTSIAARICVEGMLVGTFTGRKLGQYVHDGDADYREARRVLNGTDHAETIAGHANLFDGALVAARYGAASEPEPIVVVKETAPAPIVLTPVYEAPASVPALQPTASAGGPTSKATGGLIGAGLPNLLLLLLVEIHTIPADVASDPGTILPLTTILTALGAGLGAYLAPRNAAA
ncbi:hypothetical protein [Aureimonas sp. AU4]|uniref:hypothetical protein n=1 Tax=Aureimonas sp. AU4 TaxID=1638163 RepID=UPI000783FB98|nr:hypothetical protein [Aureimonas sp. AU4]